MSMSLPDRSLRRAPGSRRSKSPPCSDPHVVTPELLPDLVIITDIHTVALQRRTRLHLREKNKSSSRIRALRDFLCRLRFPEALTRFIIPDLILRRSFQKSLSSLIVFLTPAR
ncbi:uncharacterized [Tachysurus ichikawai]